MYVCRCYGSCHLNIYSFPRNTINNIPVDNNLEIKYTRWYFKRARFNLAARYRQILRLIAIVVRIKKNRKLKTSRDKQ